MKPYIIGLTGGIGSGKSMTAQQFNKLGATVIDADKIVHRLYEDCSACVKEIAKAFGEEIVDSEMRINRTALANKVFRSAESIAKLNFIVHPYVLDSFQQQTAKLDGLVVWDVPLLIESGMDKFTNSVVVVMADREVRVERIRARSGLTRNEICDRMNSQLADYVRLKRADYLCMNNGGQDELFEQVKNILLKIRENVGA